MKFSAVFVCCQPKKHGVKGEICLPTTYEHDFHHHDRKGVLIWTRRSFPDVPPSVFDKSNALNIHEGARACFILSESSTKIIDTRFRRYGRDLLFEYVRL